MSTSNSIAARDHELNQMILKGDILGAFEAFYAEDVEMSENAQPPCRGKAANRVREQAFVDSVGEVHAIQLLGSAVGDGVSFSEWMMDITYKGGARAQSHQAAVRRWKDGKVASERFYYNKH